MIETNNPEINVASLMERIRAKAMKISRDCDQPLRAIRKRIPAARLRLRSMVPPPPLTPIRPVNLKRERLDQLLTDARKANTVPRWIPNFLRGWFRRQGAYNKLLLETNASLVRACSELTNRVRELSAMVESQHRWARDVAAHSLEAIAAQQADAGDSLEVLAAAQAEAENSLEALAAAQVEAGNSLEALAAAQAEAGSSLEALTAGQAEAGNSLEALSARQAEAGNSLEALAAQHAEALHLQEANAEHLKTLQGQTDRLGVHVVNLDNASAAHLRALQGQADRLGVHVDNLDRAAQPVLEHFESVRLINERLRQQGNWIGREVNTLQLRFETEIKERQVALEKSVNEALARTMESLDTTFIKSTLLQHGAMLQAALDRAQLHESKEAAMNALAADVTQIIEHFKARPYMSDQRLETTDDAGRMTLGFRTNVPTHDERDLYLSFEAVFRGPESLICARQQTYVNDLRGHHPVVDLGCGRGEMLDILRAESIPAIGVDIDPGMVQRARAKGHTVEEVDALQYLRAQPDGSLGAIFSAQVIEHLPFPELLQLLDVAAQKLKAGGVMIAETVNPHSHRALKTFWVDLTHQKPIFPEVLVAFFGQFGYEQALVRFPNGTGDFERDRLSEGEYAVIAKTPLS
jgi:2-polyprenyl-3-methyl-5-hydroxy-6-metoxy-1,4-benzoquinol methylase